MENIPISDIDIGFIKIKLTDVYEYFNYLTRRREKSRNSPYTDFGLSRPRARKASIRAFSNTCIKRPICLTQTRLRTLSSQTKTRLVKYLSVDESLQLLENIRYQPYPGLLHNHAVFKLRPAGLELVNKHKGFQRGYAQSRRQRRQGTRRVFKRSMS